MDWCILQCQSPATLALVQSLSRAGLEVWTPVETRTKRVPRANVKRQVTYALMPGYAFARAHDLPELARLREGTDHKPFRIFRHNNRLPLISDAILAPLRLLERKLAPKDQAPQLHTGDRVKLTDGGFAGLTATIETPGANFTTVRLPGFPVSLKVANFYLLPSETNSVNLAA